MTEADAVMLKCPTPNSFTGVEKPEKWLTDFIEQQDASKGLKGVIDEIRTHFPNPCPFIKVNADMENMIWRVGGKKIETPALEVGLSWKF